MKIINPSYSIETPGNRPLNYAEICQFIERIGRTCYKSEDKITPESAEKFIRSLLVKKPSGIDQITAELRKMAAAGFTGSAVEGLVELVMHLQASNRPHESVIEHFGFSVRFIHDRGFTHELVRHRLAAYSQESTRYCNYAKEKFGGEITVICPPFWTDGPRYESWKAGCEAAERAYLDMLAYGAKPEEARGVLPNSLKTEIVATANIREWRHIFGMRCSERAHPQMRQVMLPLFAELKATLPVFFNDLPFK